MESIDQALAGLALQGITNIATTGDKWSIERSTLSRRWNEVTVSRPEATENSFLLNVYQTRS